MRDSKLPPIAPDDNANEPVVTWSTVPGARHYDLQTRLRWRDHESTHGEHRLDAVRAAPATRGTRRSSTRPDVSVQQGTPLLNGDTCDVYVRAFTDSAIDGTPIAGPPRLSTSFVVGGQTVVQ